MAKFRSQKNSFVAGEISPTAQGRTDLPMYQHACKTMKNVIPLVSGGFVYRPGTRHATTTTGTNPPRLIPFLYSKTEAYCVGITGAAVIALRKDPAYADSLDMTPSILSSTVTGGPIPLLNVDGYDAHFELQYAQSADILYLVHFGTKPYRITRTAADTFTVAAFDSGLTGVTFRDAWPYRPQNTSAITLSISAATVGVGRTVTASAAFFVSSHVGAVFKSDDGAGTIGCFRVTAVGNSTTATVEVMVALGTTAARLTWWESAWSDYRGWPRSICFFQQRLCYGGNTANPDSVWLSETADYNQLSHDTIVDPRSSPTGTKAFTIELTSQQVNKIQWLSSEKTLVAGTLGDEFLIGPEVASAGFGCDNAAAQVQSHYGSSYLQPNRVGDELIFAASGGVELRALIFNFEQNAYVADPLQTFFDEYPKQEQRSFYYGRKYRQAAWDSSRKVLWCVDTAGNLFGMTRDRRLEVLAWHRHELGGYDTSLRRTNADLAIASYRDPAYYLNSGAVCSVTVVPDPVKERDDVWFASLRKVNGTWKYHIEYMSGWSSFGDTAYQSAYLTDGTFHLDDFADYNNMAHLEGEPVAVVFDGTKGRTALAGKTVTAGTAVYTETAPTGTAYTVAGYSYSGIVIPVRPEAGSQIGSSQGAVKRIHQAVVRFYKTIAAKVGGDSSNLETLIFRDGSTPMGNSPEFFTGDKVVKIDCDYDRDGYIYLLQDAPLPFAVASVVLEGVTYD